MTKASNDTRAYTVIIADDHLIFRNGLKGLFQADGRWEVCGEAATGQAAVDLVAEHRPDLVTLDISMPVMNGLLAASKIRLISPHTKIVIVSMHEGASIARLALESGADLCLEKSHTGTDFIAQIESLFNCSAREASETGPNDAPAQILN